MKRIAAILIAILALFVPNTPLRLLIFTVAAALFYASTNKRKRQQRQQGEPISVKRKYSRNKVDLVAYYQAREAQSRKKSAETPPNTPLVGQELIDKVQELGDVEKSNLARACGYISISQDGKEILNFNAFYEALVEANDTVLRPSLNQNSQLDYQLTTAPDGTLVLKREYTALFNLAPGDEFVALPQTWTKSIRLLPREVAEELDGDEEYESIIRSKRYNCTIDQKLELTIPPAATQTLGAIPGQCFKIKPGRTEILLVLSNTREATKTVYKEYEDFKESGSEISKELTNVKTDMDFIACGAPDCSLEFGSIWDELKPSMATASFLKTVLSDKINDVSDIYNESNQSWVDEFKPLLVYAFGQVGGAGLNSALNGLSEEQTTDSIWIIHIPYFGLIMFDSIEEAKKESKVWYWNTAGSSGVDHFTRKPRFSIQGLESTEDPDLSQATHMVDQFFEHFAYDESTNKVSIVNTQDFDYELEFRYVYSKVSGLYFDYDSLVRISEFWPFTARFF